MNDKTRKFLETMAEHDRQIEKEFHTQLMGKWHNLPEPVMLPTQHEPPVNCRCIVWPTEAAQEAI